MIYPRPHPAEFAIDAPDSEIKPFEAWSRGLGIAFDETNGLPEMEGLNGLFQAITKYIKYLEQNGFAEWTADLEYPVGAGVRLGTAWYRAKTQNTGKNPINNQSDWELFLNASALGGGDAIYIENNTVKIRDASTTQKGAVRFANASELSSRSNSNVAVNPSQANSLCFGIGQATRSQSKSLGNTYTNTSQKTIHVYVGVSHNERVVSEARVYGVIVSRFYQDVDAATGYQNSTHSFTVPPQASYSVTGGTLIFWSELS